MQHPVKLAAILPLVASVLGCSSLSVSDGSLDYQEAKLLPPIQLPADEASRPFVPLYDLPPKTGSNELNVSNKKGNRFAMPLPPSLIDKQQ